MTTIGFLSRGLIKPAISSGVMFLGLLLFCPLLAPAVSASETKSELESFICENAEFKKPSLLPRFLAYLKKHPNDADVLTMTGRFLACNHRCAEARPYFLKALKISPTYSRAYAGLAFCDIDSKNYSAAYENSVKALARNEIDTDRVVPELNLLKNFKILCLKTGHSQQAPAVQRQIDQVLAVNQATIFREQGVLDKAADILTAEIKKDPSLSYAYLLRGTIYNNRSEHQKAIKDFDSTIALLPGLATSYYLRGDSNFELGNKARAVEDWKRALKVKSVAFPDVVAYNYTAMTGRYREHFEPNDESIVNRADVHYLCGVAEADLKEYDLAIKDYSQCIALDARESKAYFERAKLHELLGHHDLLLADLDQAIKINPRYIEALLERAKVYEKSHDNARAMADYSRVIAINANDFGSYIMRAELSLRIKNYEQALADFGQAMRLSPTDDDPVIGRARVYTAMGRYQDALADYRQAIKINPHERSVILEAMAKVEKLKRSAALPLR